MKKVLTLAMALTMLIVAGCGGGSSTTPASSSAPAAPASIAPTASTPASAGPDLTQGDKYTIKVSHSMTAESSYHRSVDQEFKKIIEEKTGGRITVEIYPSSQLGGERQAFESVGLGTIEMTLVNTANVANVDTNFSIFDFPFLFTSTEAAYEACDDEVGDFLMTSIEEYGYKCFGLGEVGMRYITNSKRPITKPEDLKGIKLRCMENPVHVAAFSLMGANPTPMALNELFTALQQGTVDGQENPPAVIYDNKFNEVQKYLSKTGHVYHPLAYVANLDWFNSLSADDQALIAECGQNAALKQREMITADNVVALEKMAASGMQINDLTDEEGQVFVEAMAPIHTQFADKVAPGLVDKARSYNK